ncbi:MAG TPA: ABC transporter permease [Candidatus Acidoferrales bacterium]|nr:ABC transporter permease [Candidatus Acidoferrales bacterium]
MRAIRRFLLRIRNLRRRDQGDLRLRQEIDHHLDMQAAENVRFGMSPAEARRQASLKFGSVESAREIYRAEHGFSFLDAFFQDVRYAVRMLRKSPGFAFIAVLTLALGIGANTALFTVINSVLLNPLPYPHSGRLVAVYGTTPGVYRGPITYLNFLDWEHDTGTLSSIAMYRNQDYNFTGSGEPERVSGFMISAGFFATLGIQPVLGRTFRANDDRIGAAPVVILSGGFWQRRFGSSPDIIGKSLTLNGVTYTVIGVIPSSFTFYGQMRDVYTPIGQWSDPSFRDRRIDMSAHSIGRIKPGVSLAQAQADMDAVARSLAATYPEADKNVGISLISMKEDIVGKVQPFLIVLLAAVGFLLLIACANVANLLLARSIGRSREFAVRAALGAGQARLLRQLLTESILLAGCGGILGLLLAFWGTRAVLDALPSALPRAGEVALDSRVLLFTLGISFFAGILFGLAPALKTSRVNLHEILKESGRGSSGVRHRLQGVFVAAEIAMALVLLIGAGLMIRSLAELWQVNPGFNPDHAITFDLSLPQAANTTSAQTRARLRLLDNKMRAIPGVQAVSITLGSRPMIHDSSLPFWIDGQPKPATIQDMHQAMFYLVESGFERAMGVKLERGRFVTDSDNEHAPVVIDIDDVFARTYFPGENPIGKHIHLALFNVDPEIVGVVGHIKQWGLDADPKSAIEAQFDYPFMQLPEKLMPLVADAVAVVLRTKGDPTAVMEPVRRAVQEIDPRVVVYSVSTMDEVVATSFAARRFSMILLAIFAALALALSCVGIYGVISYLVGQRTHEIGVRMALGAQRRDVMRLVLGHGARMALIGIAIGVVAALGLTRLMAGELFGVTAHDPLTFLAVAVVLVIVALLASYVPARRAMRVDPVVALRCE